MDLVSNHQEVETPIPITCSTYAGGVLHLGHQHQHHINKPLSSSSNGGLNHNPTLLVVRYRECLKNHAAAIGGNATDGCGEFMPGGEEGTLEALNCSACNCHRNFHRKEMDQDGGVCESSLVLGRKFILGGQQHKKPLKRSDSLGNKYSYHRATTTTATLMPSSCSRDFVQPPSESDEQVNQMEMKMVNNKKRFRTKFTQEQKEKMLSFAEKAGWKIQKQEESVVQQICQEIGIKRRVLKVWMHNNKHNLAMNKINNSSSTT